MLKKKHFFLASKCIYPLKYTQVTLKVQDVDISPNLKVFNNFKQHLTTQRIEKKKILPKVLQQAWH